MKKLNPEVADILKEKDPWFAGLRGARDSFYLREGREHDMPKLSQFQLETSAGMFDSVVYTENGSRN